MAVNEKRSGSSAAPFGVTCERVRQIENNTLKTIASLPEAHGLRRISEQTYGDGSNWSAVGPPVAECVAWPSPERMCSSLLGSPGISRRR
jgi:hypothetical protein